MFIRFASQKFKCWTVRANLSTKFCHASNVYRTCSHLPFCTTFSDIAGVRSLAETQSSWCHIFAHFSSDQDDIWCGAEAIQTEHPSTALSEILLAKGNNCCFTGCIKKQQTNKFYIGMHSFIYEQTWFTLDVTIDAFRLYSLIWYGSKWPQPWLSVTRVQDSKTFCTICLAKFPTDLKGIWYAVRFVGLINVMLIPCPINIEGRQLQVIMCIKKENTHTHTHTQLLPCAWTLKPIAFKLVL